MLKIISILVILSYISLIECTMEGFVVGGKYATIRQFPHSAFMNVLCHEASRQTIAWICGASIVNDKIMLTAAHCMAGCTYKSFIAISVGDSNKEKGAVSSALSYLLHELYNEAGTTCDIALVRLTTPLKYSKSVKRLALMKNPPYYETAQIAGWGITDEETFKTENTLKYINQHVWKSRACKRKIPKLSKGTICASSRDDDSYPSWGDSGSALVVRGYIQIGIVSFKVPKISRSLVVYTDTGYFYDWIKKNSILLQCI